MIPYPLIRPLLFALDAERAHELTLRLLALADSLGFAHSSPVTSPPVAVMGLQFPNRIGLAAGLDKNGTAVDGLSRLGFGFLEVGTVTPRPQPGNPKPRLFRLTEHQAIINRMGFNNAGVDALLERLASVRFRGILGINIGKNFDTPIEQAVDDYLICLDKAYRQASYITVNISSPNTKNLRQLQGVSELDALLAALKSRLPALPELVAFRTIIQTLGVCSLCLLGVAAAFTPLPVVGVPIESKSLKGLDSLLSIVQMPSGIPVATVAIGGARNAGLLAVQILAVGDAALQEKFLAFKARLAEESRAKNEKLVAATPS